MPLKVLRDLLPGAGIDSETLRPLFKQGGAITYAVTVDGEDAFENWDALRDLVPRTRRWPVLLNAPEFELQAEGRAPNRTSEGSDLKSLFEARQSQLDGQTSTRKILQKAVALDFPSWIEGRQRETIEALREEIARSEEHNDHEFADRLRADIEQPAEFRGIPRGEWRVPRPDFKDRAFLACDLRQSEERYSVPVTLALLPTPHPSEAAAYLKFGGWNANPASEVHVAAHRYWHERYDALLVASTHDEMEFLVGQPPRTREDALLLAKWQFFYCEDTVHQNGDSIDTLAAQLLDSEVWYFWWD